MADFNYIPELSATPTRKPRVVSVQFGGGYREVRPDGINNDAVSWDLTFSDRPPGTVDAINTFLRAKNGVTAFTWTTPEGETIYVRCADWTAPYIAYGVRSLSATFTQEFV